MGTVYDHLRVSVASREDKRAGRNQRRDGWAMRLQGVISRSLGDGLAPLRQVRRVDALWMGWGLLIACLAFYLTWFALLLLVPLFVYCVARVSAIRCPQCHRSAFGRGIFLIRRSECIHCGKSLR